MLSCFDRSVQYCSGRGALLRWLASREGTRSLLRVAGGGVTDRWRAAAGKVEERARARNKGTERSETSRKNKPSTTQGQIADSRGQTMKLANILCCAFASISSLLGDVEAFATTGRVVTRRSPLAVATGADLFGSLSSESTVTISPPGQFLENFHATEAKLKEPVATPDPEPIEQEDLTLAISYEVETPAAPEASFKRQIAKAAKFIVAGGLVLVARNSAKALLGRGIL